MDFHLWLQIDANLYYVVPADHPAGRAWELRKKKGKRKVTWVPYLVYEDQHGAHCDCASFTYNPNIEGCKHIRALRAKRMLRKL